MQPASATPQPNEPRYRFAGALYNLLIVEKCARGRAKTRHAKRTPSNYAREQPARKIRLAVTKMCTRPGQN